MPGPDAPAPVRPQHSTYCDAKFLQIVEGINELQRLLIADYALGYRQDR